MQTQGVMCEWASCFSQNRSSIMVKCGANVLALKTEYCKWIWWWINTNRPFLEPNEMRTLWKPIIYRCLNPLTCTAHAIIFETSIFDLSNTTSIKVHHSLLAVFRLFYGFTWSGIFQAVAWQSSHDARQPPFYQIISCHPSRNSCWVSFAPATRRREEADVFKFIYVPINFCPCQSYKSFRKRKLLGILLAVTRLTLYTILNCMQHIHFVIESYRIDSGTTFVGTAQITQN